MEKIEAVELINTLLVVSSEGDGEVLIYAYVENDERTKKVLEKLKADEWIGSISPLSYEEYFKSENDENWVDIAPIAFQYAEWFDGKEFLLYQP